MLRHPILLLCLSLSIARPSWAAGTGHAETTDEEGESKGYTAIVTHFERDAKVPEGESPDDRKKRYEEARKEALTAALKENGEKEKAFDALLADPGLKKLVEAGSTTALYEKFGATDPEAREQVNKLVAKNMAERDPASLYKHYYSQHIGGTNKRNEALDSAVDGEVKKLVDTHKEMLTKFKAAGVRGGTDEWRAIRLEMSEQAINKAKKLAMGTPEADKKAAWAQAGKVTDGLMSSITNRPQLAQLLLKDGTQGEDLARFIGRAAEASTMTPVPKPATRADLLNLNAAESEFQTAFRNNWVGEDGGISRIKDWNSNLAASVASGDKETLNAKYPGWTDHAMSTQNADAVWLANTNQSGIWEYKANDKTYQLSNKASLNAFFATVDKQNCDPAAALKQMEKAQENVAARNSTSEKSAAGIGTTVSVPIDANRRVSLDAFATYYATASNANEKGAEKNGDKPVTKSVASGEEVSRKAAGKTCAYGRTCNPRKPTKTIQVIKTDEDK
jgi:hypothetical protein